MTRNSTVTVEARLNRIGTPPASAGTPRTSLSNMLITTRTLGNRALRSVLAMLRKYLISTAPGLIRRRARLFSFAARPVPAPASSPPTARHRHRPGSRACVAQPVPLAGSPTSPVWWPRRKKRISRKSSTGASTSTRVTVAFAMRLLDLGMGHLDEIGALEHRRKRFDQLARNGARAWRHRCAPAGRAPD